MFADTVRTTLDSSAPGGDMASIKERVTNGRDERYVACYRDPEGRQRSADTCSTRLAG